MTKKWKMIDYDAIFNDFKAGKVFLLYKKIYPGLLIFASDLLGEELAYLSEDCVQDAILDSYINRHRFETAAKWRSYLLTVIRNRAIDSHRKLNSRLNFLSNGYNEDTEEDISVAMIAQETFDQLYSAIDSLPQHYREIFDLSFEQGLKNTEIAARLGLSEIGVKKRKARMIDILRKKLGLGSSDDVILLIASAHFAAMTA